LKNFAIGRRNWLFAKSIRGAQASATVYSITETALLNGLKPYNYLTYVMEKMKDLGAFPAKEEMLELLPWSSNLPDDCRSKLKK
ncbi:IS66 C-terminal element, partial [Enterocloster clostridioformis]